MFCVIFVLASFMFSVFYNGKQKIVDVDHVNIWTPLLWPRYEVPGEAGRQAGSLGLVMLQVN